MRCKGFTLFELLLSVALLAVIASMVYAAFVSVTSSSSLTRTETEELRFRQFLIGSFETNFATVYSDPTYSQPVFRFLGVNEEAAEGARDSVRFCSTAPVIGGLALPGDIKEVRYEVLEPSSEMELDSEERAEEEQMPSLQVGETPLLAGNVQALDEATGAFVAAEGYQTPSWAVPIRTFDLTYFDGTDWLEAWDSLELGRMPWAVRIHLNFAKTEEELQEEKARNLSLSKDPDFELVIPIPTGIGVKQDLRALQAIPGQVTTEQPQAEPSEEQEVEGESSEPKPQEKQQADGLSGAS